MTKDLTWNKIFDAQRWMFGCRSCYTWSSNNRWTLLKSRLKCRFLTLRYAFYYKEYLWFSKVNVNIPTKFLWNTSIPFLEYVLKNYQLLEWGCLNFVLIYLCKNNGFCKLTDIYLELNPLSISIKFTCCVLTKIVSLHLAIIVFPFSCK